MSLITYFLATNQEVQEHLLGEVNDAIAQNGGDQHLDYNAIQSLPYLDQVGFKF
jgi:tetrahydromethanopterin S-methyltransferase subunit A